MNGILKSMKCSEAVREIRENLAETVMLFDVDGTLAPIVSRPELATVPETTRKLIKRLMTQAKFVACISGRPALQVRKIVSIPELLYIGLHGAELLPPDSKNPQLLEELTDWPVKVDAFTSTLDSDTLAEAGVTVEKKSLITALHWRSATDKKTAVKTVESIRIAAQQAGLTVHTGRKVLELRPPVEFDKGRAIAKLLNEGSFQRVVYFGDDLTDIDALLTIRQLKADHQLDSAVGVAVKSDETPSGLIEASDLSVNGPEGVVTLLEKVV